MDWLEDLLDWPLLRRWPVAEQYEVVPTPGGEILQAVGPLSHAVDLSAGRALIEVISWHSEARKGAAGKLRIASRTGLVGDWQEDDAEWFEWRAPGTIDSDLHFMNLRPPRDQSLDDYRKCAEWLSLHVANYKRGFAEVWKGERSLENEEGQRARTDFGNFVEDAQRLFLSGSSGVIPAVEPITRVLDNPGHGLSRFPLQWMDPKTDPNQGEYTPADLGMPGPELEFLQSRFRRYEQVAPTVMNVFAWRRPLSVFEVAIAQLIEVLQSKQPFKECKNADCKRLFTKPEPRPGAKGKWARDDSRFCRQQCARLVRDRKAAEAKRKEGDKT